MAYFKINLNEAKNNNYFRKEVYTSNKAQIVLMSLLPNEDIGEEIHADVDQILIFADGRGKAILNQSEFEIKEDDVLYIPHSTEHNIINTGSEEMKIISIYAPPEHPRGTIHDTKAEALKQD
ncbi:MAG: cupin domain-containing protein [Patescibacteria group bacterium]